MSPNELILIPEEPTRLLHYIGTDEWARPVYQDQYGKLWKDVELGDFEIPHLHSAVGNEFDGEPDMPIRKPFKILTDKPKNPYEFQYMMLSRLQSDCEYYLNYGNRCTGRLYYLDEEKQIAAMKKLWNDTIPEHTSTENRRGDPAYCLPIFFHPDYTVGFGIAPNPAVAGSRTVPPIGNFTLP